MKVLLINAGSYYVMQKTIIPLGLLSIATYLTNNGHTAMIYDRAIEGGSANKYMDSFFPDIVGISSLTFGSFPDAIKLSKLVRKRNIPVVWGGQIPSLVPEIVLQDGNADFVVMGDGEIALLDLINAITNKTSYHDIDGLAFIEDGEIIVNKQREFADLSQFPVIDWSFVDPRKYFIRNVNCKRTLHVYSSKGCPGQCTYCYNPCFSKGTWRARPMEHVLCEIKYLVDNYKVDGIYFADDLISPNKEYIYNFCKNIRESNIDFLWGCNLRADSCTKEELQMLYDSGCRWIFFGIESGSQERQKLIKKRLNLEKTKETIDNCSEIGISTTTSFIVGYPDETEDELKETVKYLIDLKSDVKIAAIYGVIPKSELYDNLVKNNRIEAPKTYNEWDKLKWLDKIGKNFSKVPGKDLKVIVNCVFLMIIGTKSGNTDEKSRFWLKRLFGQTFDLLKGGTIKSLVLFILSGAELLKIIYYSKFFPRIRKKYGFK